MSAAVPRLDPNDWGRAKTITGLVAVLGAFGVVALFGQTGARIVAAAFTGCAATAALLEILREEISRLPDRYPALAFRPGWKAHWKDDLALRAKATARIATLMAVGFTAMSVILRSGDAWFDIDPGDTTRAYAIATAVFAGVVTLILGLLSAVLAWDFRRWPIPDGAGRWSYRPINLVHLGALALAALALLVWRALSA